MTNDVFIMDCSECPKVIIIYMENNNSHNQTVDLIQGIETVSLQIKEKYEYLVFKDPANIDQTLLDLVNAVALIRNLSKDIFSFIFLKTEEQRKQMF